MDGMVDYNVEYAHIYAKNLPREAGLGEDVKRQVEIVKCVVSQLEKEGKTFCLAVLVDDYDPPEPPVPFSHEYIHGKLSEYGLSPDYILRESSFVSYADRALKKLAWHEDEFGGLRVHETIDPHLRSQSPHSTEFLFGIDDASGEAKQGGAGEPASLTEKLGLNGLDRVKEPDVVEIGSEGKKKSKFNLLVKYKEGVCDVYACPLLAACWHLTRLGILPFDQAISDGCRFTDKAFVGNHLLTVVSSKYLQIESTASQILRRYLWSCEIQRESPLLSTKSQKKKFEKRFEDRIEKQMERLDYVFC